MFDLSLTAQKVRVLGITPKHVQMDLPQVLGVKFSGWYWKDMQMLISELKRSSSEVASKIDFSSFLPRISLERHDLTFPWIEYLRGRRIASIHVQDIRKCPFRSSDESRVVLVPLGWARMVQKYAQDGIIAFIDQNRVRLTDGTVGLIIPAESRN